MGFNFPPSPTVGQEYTSGSATYVWNGYGWNVKAAIQEAPVNGKIYGRKDAAWAEVISDVTKAYVDAEVAKQVAATGDTMTGQLIISQGPYAAAIKLVNTTGNLSKTIRMGNTSELEIINSAYTAGIFGLTDAGALWLASSITSAAGGITAANAARLSPTTSVDTAAFIASGSYGGGITFQDGAWRSAIWAQSSNLALATGATNPPGIKLLLAANNAHQLTGSLTASAQIVVGPLSGIHFRQRSANYGVLHYQDNSTYYLLITNNGDPDGSYGALRPFHVNLSSGHVSMSNAATVSGRFTNVGTMLAYGWAGDNNQSLIFMNAAETKYFHCDGTNYHMYNGHLYTAAGRVLGVNDGSFGNYMPTWGGTFTGAIHTNSTLSCSGNLWVHGGVFYGSAAGHYFQWDGNWNFVHGRIYNGGWVPRTGVGEVVSFGESTLGGVIAYGYRFKNGVNGGYTNNWYNTGWPSGGSIEAWVDATSWGWINTSCDYRFKKDVRPLASMWDKVKNLRPIRYSLKDWSPPVAVENQKKVGEPMIKADDEERWGFFAHELQESLIPTAASGKKDSHHEVQGPNNISIIAALTKALQEAMSRIEQLEERTSHA